MKKKKEKKELLVDRRIQKTKKVLFDALMDLILEKGYEAVTIQEIIDKANVGRSTFYSHYESKEQLLFSGDEHFHSILVSDQFQHKKKYSAQDKLKLVYEHVASHFNVTKAMLGGKGSTPMLEHAQRMMFVIAEGETVKTGLNKHELKMQQYVIESAASALVKLLTCWLNDDMPFNSEDMASRGNKILKAIIT